MARLVLGLVGPLRLKWDGTEIPAPTSPRAQLLLARLARAPMGMPRAALAELIWGPDKLRNLRQELYRLRQLPGAETWLDAGDPVRITAQVELDPAKSRVWLDDLPRHRLTESGRNWLEAEESSWRATIDGGEAVASLRPLLAVCPHEPPPLDVLAEATGHTIEALMAAWETAAPLPELDDASARAAHRRLAVAWSGRDDRRAAAHWEWAGEADRAAESSLQAGDDAAALRLAVTPALRLRALQARVDRLERAGGVELDEAITSLERAALAASDDPAWVSARLARARHHLANGRHEESEMASRPFLDDATHEPAARLIQAQRLMTEGRFSEAADHYTRVRDLDDPVSACIATTGLGVICALRGDPDTARTHHIEALRRGRALKRSDLICRCLLNLGADDQRSGHLAASIAHFREVTELAPSTGDPVLLALAWTNLGITLVKTGDLGEARPAATAAIDATRVSDRPRIRALAIDLRAEVELLCGRHAEAARWSAQAMEIHARLGDVHRREMSRGNTALARLCTGDPSAIPEALGALEGLVDRPLVRAELRTQLALLPPVALATPFLDDADPSPAGALAQARAHPAAAWRPELDRLVAEPGPHRAFSAALAAHRGHLDPEELGRVLSAKTRGLLTTQREALQSWLDRWIRGG